MRSTPIGRRSHRKSRAGCLACKRRKVKVKPCNPLHCDEAKPTCGNCERHGVPCSFTATPDPVRLEHEAASPAIPARHSTGTASPSIGPPAPQAPLNTSLPVFDMELLHHYMVSTCYTLSRIPSIQAIYRDEVPRVGFTMPAVLHAMLAVAALHLARSDPSRRDSCIAQAHMHHQTAVQSVTPNIPFLASDNGVGLFLFSSLTCISACASVPSERSFLVLFEQGRLANWVLLFRGTRTVIEYSRHDFNKGKLGPIFMNGAQTAAARDPQTFEQGKMYTWELKQMIGHEFMQDQRLRGIYEETLDALSRTLGVVMKPGEGPRLQTADVFAWLLEASDEYLELLAKEEPVALIIFGYFCVALRQIEWMWWMEGLSGRLMSQLYSVIDEKYRGWLRWPQEQICWAPGSI
ncbi:C6 transcription factor [Penicillium longicatenatum]|uniref:C6 transcription factor n=1 Tax=Penicillium longicatenatum TaxID=1561947 RepID=UPI002546BB31|nr:C6 transcription factor [Penicillium longicatenatum]KAJ5658531.1 C6 transcription factor [Penicillium longicatenatum]